MRIATAFFVVCLLSGSTSWGQEIATPAKPAAPTLSESDQARLRYYLEIKDYILRYAQTPASCTEIVEAALSTYDEDCRKILPYANGFKVLTWQEQEQTTEKLRETTKRWAMKVALEAKYPDPSVFKSPTAVPGQDPSTGTQSPGAKTPKKSGSGKQRTTAP